MANPSNDELVAFASQVVVDPKVKKHIPTFDAPFYQAGLAGYSDAAMRIIAREHGCPFCVTEALLDTTLINGGKGRTKEDPEILASEDQGRTQGAHDHPIAGQVIGANPETMAEGASILVSLGYDVIDVNLACPPKRVRRRNRGGYFLKAPTEAVAILAAVREVVPNEIPTTLKLRRGFDDTEMSVDNFYTIFDGAMDLGYLFATVHGRSVEQRYNGPSRWSFLEELVRARPNATIFGSGDIWSAADIFKMMQQTGVKGVSVARGCIGNPWIFTQARALMSGEEPVNPTIKEQRGALLRHFELCKKLHGEKTASRLMRKFGLSFSAHHPEHEEVRKEFIKIQSEESWKAVLDTYYCVS
jgi:nifR3 family TIM-barrel protein